MALRGERIGTAYVRILADGSGLDESIRQKMADSDDAVADGARDHADIYQDTFAERNDKNHKIADSLDNTLHEAFAKMRADADFAGSDIGNRLREKITEHLRLTNKDKRETEEIGRRMTAHLLTGFTKTGELGDIRAAFHKTLEDMHRDTQRVDRDTPIMRRFGDSIDRIGDVVSKGFGRGARNNFFNLVGVIVKGAFSIVSIVPKAAQAIFDFGKKISTAFGGAADDADAFNSSMGSTFKGVMASLAQAAAGGYASLVILAGAMQLVVYLSGFIVSGISSIIAILAALASSIAFGIVGALAPLAGLIAPIAAVIGGLALAFIGMDKAAKKTMTETLKPLKKVFTDIGDEVRKGLFSNLGPQVKRLKAIFDAGPFKEFARNIGKAISGIADSFLDVLESPAFKKFARTMSKALPRQIGMIGDIGAQAFKGMAGIMRGLVPITDRFLKWVKDLASRFAKWINSTAGQKAFKDFLEKAADSAKSLGHFIKAVWDFIKPILEGGKSTGDSIIDKMADAIERAAKWLESKEGQKALKQWFEDAKKLAGKIGEVALAIIGFIDTLDTPENRKTVQDFFGGLSKVITFITDHWGVITFWIKWLSPIGQIILLMRGVVWLFGKAKDAWDWLSKKFGEFRDKLNGLDKKVEDLGRTIKNAPGKAFNWLKTQFEKAYKFIADKVGDLRDKMNQLGDKVEDLGDDIKKKLGDAWAWVRTKFGDAVSWIRGKLADLGGWFRDKFNDIRGWAADAWDAVRSKAADMVSAVTGKLGDIIDWFRDLPGKIRGYADSMVSAGKSLGGSILSGIISGINGAASFAGDLFSGVRSALVSIVNGVINLLNQAIPNSLGWGKLKINLPESPIPTISAAGGVFNRPTFAMVGEAGPEAVVPLSRNLAQVDPAVRSLSAVAQGQPFTGGSVNVPVGKSVDVGGITIITPTEDPRAVAAETVNRIIAATYF